MTGTCRSAASPTGPPAAPTGSRAQASSSVSGMPSDAARTRAPSSSRWMASRSLPSAAPSADRISESDDDGSAATSRPASPCSRVSWRRAEESTDWPETSATTSSGCTSLGSTSVTTRPCRSTTIRSASRNISSVSCPDSRIVVPCARSRVISRSTSAASRTPSDAVGSSSSRDPRVVGHRPRDRHHLPLPAGQQLDGPGGVPQRDAEPLKQPAARPCAAPPRRTGACGARCRASRSRRRPGCRTAPGPARPRGPRASPPRRATGATACPPTRIDPETGVRSPAMARMSVVLPAPFSPARATSSPARSARLTPSSAVSSPKRTVSPDTASSGVPLTVPRSAPFVTLTIVNQAGE